MQRYRYHHSIPYIDTQTGKSARRALREFLHRGIASGHLLRLQILDLELVYKPQLPDNVGDLSYLIYLGKWAPSYLQLANY